MPKFMTAILDSAPTDSHADVYELQAALNISKDDFHELQAALNICFGKKCPVVFSHGNHSGFSPDNSNFLFYRSFLYKKYPPFVIYF
jgi:hypothetical protein